MAKPLRVWSKFTATRETGTLKFCILEPPSECMEEIFQLLLNHFVKEESLIKAAGLAKNEEAVVEFKETIKKMMTDESTCILVCCLDSDNDNIGEIIGGSFMELVKKDAAPDFEKPKSKELQKFFSMIFAMANKYDIIKAENIDQHYDGRGVVVNSKYRGYGIAQELLRVRRLVCKEQGVPLTSALMTAYGTQKAAERDGWETVLEVNFEEFGKEHDVFFEGGPPTAKLMIARIS